MIDGRSLPLGKSHLRHIPSKGSPGGDDGSPRTPSHADPFITEGGYLGHQGRSHDEVHMDDIVRRLRTFTSPNRPPPPSPNYPPRAWSSTTLVRPRAAGSPQSVPPTLAFGHSSPSAGLGTAGRVPRKGVASEASFDMNVPSALPRFIAQPAPGDPTHPPYSTELASSMPCCYIISPSRTRGRVKAQRPSSHHIYPRGPSALSSTLPIETTPRTDRPAPTRSHRSRSPPRPLSRFRHEAPCASIYSKRHHDACTHHPQRPPRCHVFSNSPRLNRLVPRIFSLPPNASCRSVRRAGYVSAISTDTPAGATALHASDHQRRDSLWRAT